MLVKISRCLTVIALQHYYCLVCDAELVSLITFSAQCAAIQATSSSSPLIGQLSAMLVSDWSVASGEGGWSGEQRSQTSQGPAQLRMNWSLLFNTFWEALSCSVTSLRVVLSLQSAWPLLAWSAQIFQIFDGLGKTALHCILIKIISGEDVIIKWSVSSFCVLCLELYWHQRLYNCCLDYPIFYPIIVLSEEWLRMSVMIVKSCLQHQRWKWC